MLFSFSIFFFVVVNLLFKFKTVFLCRNCILKGAQFKVPIQEGKKSLALGGILSPSLWSTRRAKH